MIFKYFSYDNNIGDWRDNKYYISLCSKFLEKVETNQLAHYLHKSLCSKKLISMPYENFRYSDYSKSSTGKMYSLFNIVGNKRINFAKLSQLVLKKPKSSNKFYISEEVWGPATNTLRVNNNYIATSRRTGWLDELTFPEITLTQPPPPPPPLPIGPQTTPVIPPPVPANGLEETWRYVPGPTVANYPMPRLDDIMFDDYDNEI